MRIDIEDTKIIVAIAKNMVGQNDNIQPSAQEAKVIKLVGELTIAISKIKED